MKKLIVILGIFLSSCTDDIHDYFIIESRVENNNQLRHWKYTINDYSHFREGSFNTHLTFYSNKEYKIGDTLK